MTPRYKDVPELWKHPSGPYRQAPEEYGGEWWLVDPFVGVEPWTNQAAKAKDEGLPAGFVEIFGPRPKGSDFHQERNPSVMYRVARDHWDQDLRYFKQAGLPEWANQEQAKLAQDLYLRWGMGEPRYYEGRYGWMGRFPFSEIKDFEAPALSVLASSHLVVAQYQIKLAGRGVIPSMKHPFVPPHVWGREDGKKEDR